MRNEMQVRLKAKAAFTWLLRFVYGHTSTHVESNWIAEHFRSSLL